MKTKRFFLFGRPTVLRALPASLAMGLVVAAAALALTGCGGEDKAALDTWSSVTSLDQIHGTWKGSYRETRTMKEFIQSLPEGSEVTWNEGMAIIFADMNVTVSADMLLTIDAEAKTAATSGSATTAFSGGAILLVWPSLKDTILSQAGEAAEKAVVNDANHSLTMPLDTPAQQMTEAETAEMLAGMQINRDGTKIKVSPESVGADIPEIIFEKQ
jgi:hypothetical protein